MSLAMQTYPTALIIYSSNIVCWEQKDAFCEIRTFVLVCAKGQGFVAIARKAQGDGYHTLKRWKLDTKAAVSFHLPSDMSYKLDVRLLPEMQRRYQVNEKAWSGISTSTRYNGLMPVTRGNAKTCQ